MKTTKKILFVIIVLFLTILAGCMNGIGYGEQYIEVQMWVDGENQYEDFKEIMNNTDVQKVRDIISNIEWENVKVEMEPPADYRFIFQYKNPNIQAKAVTYNLWLNNDVVEIAKEDHAYAKLNKEDSSILIEILTGENSPN
ncbi:hypothetical protein [Ureibacillus acetophenoni]